MKKLYVFILIILLPIFTFGQAKKLYRQATRATNPNEKIELLTKVIALEPKNFDAYFYRGIAKNELGDYFGAILDYTKIQLEFLSGYGLMNFLFQKYLQVHVVLELFLR